jgi:radical SAM superfamily enzyme YgiQ (UPF0313 family)
MSALGTELLLTHGYLLGEDAHERKHMAPYPPLGILHLSTFLRAAGHRVAIHDSTFSTREALWARLDAREAPVLGISANMLTRGAVLDIIARARAAGLRVVVGGPDPPNYPEAYLAAGADVVVFGEGEAALAELLPILGRSAALDAPELDLAALAGVAGIAFLDADGKLQKSPARPALRDLDALGWPDREAIDLRAYLDCWRQHHGYSSLNIITARGCPYRCRWCSHSVFGFGHARRSPENVADEVATLQRRYAPDQLWYADDVFSISKPWLRAYAEAMEARGLRIPFECITRADRVDAEVVALLRRLACRRVWLGSESGSARILDAMERGVSPAQIQAAASALREAGIALGFFVMWGYEGETGADIAETVAHVRRCLPDRCLTTVAYPMYGTPYFDAVADRVVAGRPWAEASERDHRIRGRHSKAYYAAASAWLQAELEDGRRAAEGQGAWAAARIPARLRSRRARLQLRLRAGEREA